MASATISRAERTTLFSEGHVVDADQATGLAPKGTTVAGQRRNLTGLR